jgi:hypothetical protein
MGQIILYPFNLLGESGVTVTANADSAYPKTRLYDRSLNYYWQYTQTGAFTITVDQGASYSLYVDFLAVGIHNFINATIAWQYSSNGSSWTNAVDSWYQTSGAQIVKTLTTPLLYRYWRLSVGSVASPRCVEVYMSLGHSFRIVWDSTPTGSEEDSVEWIKTVGNLERSIKTGDARKMRDYPIFHHTSTSTLTSFRSAMSYLDGYSKPFFVKDHESGYWLARMTSVSKEDYNSEGVAFRTLSLVEMI